MSHYCVTPFQHTRYQSLCEPAVFTVISPLCTSFLVGCVNCTGNMGILASRGIEYEDSYRSFTEKERQQLVLLFDRLATANEQGAMKVELEPFKVRI